MATLEELLQTLSARLDESIDYVNLLRAQGYRSPEGILDAGSAEDLSRECALPIGDAKRIWKAAGGTTGRLKVIHEDTTLEMTEIRDYLHKITESMEEMCAINQISGLASWKLLRWTRSTASDGDLRPSNEAFRLALVDKYFPGKGLQDISCMVTGAKTKAIGAHIMSYSKKDVARMWLAMDNIDSWRNGLLWCLPIEEAWEDSRICLTYHPVPNLGFVLHVLDDRLLELPITFDFPGLLEGHMTKLLGTGAKRNLGSTLWKDLDGRQINYHFTRETLPYKRAIAFHAKCAYKQADQRGHVPASFDVALLDHENWSLQDTKQKVERYLKGLQTLDSSVADVSSKESSNNG